MTRLLDMCPKVMLNSAAGYKAETDPRRFSGGRGWCSADRAGEGSLVLLGAILAENGTSLRRQHGRPLRRLPRWSSQRQGNLSAPV
jgi:hypothetical protein